MYSGVHISLSQDSEETIHSAEKGYFHCKEHKKKSKKKSKKIKKIKKSRSRSQNQDQNQSKTKTKSLFSSSADSQ